MSKVLNFAALLCLQYRPMVHVMLFPMINILYFNISTFQSGVRGGVVVKVAGSIPDGVIGIFQ